MSKKALLAAVVILLLGGAIAIIASNRNPSSSAGETGAQAQPAARGERPVAGDSGGPGAAPDTRRPRPSAVRPTAAYPELIAEYGEARTKLSRQIAGNVVILLDEVMALGELATTGGFARGEGLGALGGLEGRLALNDEQRAKAEELLADFQKRQMEKSKAALENLRRDPESLMRIMLASDAYSRGEITEDQYKSLRASSQAELAGLINPLAEQSFQSGRTLADRSFRQGTLSVQGAVIANDATPLADETFRQGMLQVLDPQQAETFNSAADKLPKSPAGDPGNIANIQAMELEMLDKTITSSQTLTRGIQQMLEGLRGLNER
jgi:hypothetical protein